MNVPAGATRISIPRSPNLVVPSLSLQPREKGAAQFVDERRNRNVKGDGSFSEISRPSEVNVENIPSSPPPYILASMDEPFKSPRAMDFSGVSALAAPPSLSPAADETSRSLSDPMLSGLCISKPFSSVATPELGHTEPVSARASFSSPPLPPKQPASAFDGKRFRSLADEADPGGSDKQPSGDGIRNDAKSSTFVGRRVVSPVKSGTVHGVRRLWHLVVWVIRHYTHFFVNCLRFYLGIYHGFRILVDIYGLLGVHWIGRVGLLRPLRWLTRQLFGGSKGRRITMLHRSLAKSHTYEEWRAISEQLDEVTGAKEWCIREEPDVDAEDEHLYDSKALRSHLEALRSARAAGNIPETVFLLRVCCNRHFCHLRNPSLYSVSFVHTKRLIEDFYDEVITSLDYLNNHIIEEDEDISGIFNDECGTDLSHMNDFRRSLSGHKVGLSARELLKLLSALRLSMGRTALCLSGGGALAVYHMGILRSLIERGMVPKVISGTSGGAISAGAMAIWNDDELLRNYLRPGFLEEWGLSLCPPLRQQLKHLWQTGYLLDQRDYIQLARTLYGEITFSEAFQRTGRFVSITTVPAGRSGPCEPLVCNCINTPDILIWSAVVASCSLPLVLPPTALFTKSRLTGPLARGLKTHRNAVGVEGGVRRRHPADRAASPPSAIKQLDTEVPPRCGTLVCGECVQTETPRVGDSALPATRFVSDLSDAPVEGDVSRYAPDSMLFVDGSILQDIPHTELQTLFNVKSFVVSQVNPHFTPFVQGPSGYRNQKGALRWALDHCWNYLALDLRNRYARLLALAIVPKIRGQDVSPFLMQSAEGHVTIVPAPPSEFWKLTTQPSSDDIKRAMHIGERKLWPYFTRLKHVLMVENKLRQLWVENLRQFEGRSHSSTLTKSKLRSAEESHRLIISRYRSRPTGSVVGAEELLG